MKFKIRFNKSRGQPGRGSMDHAWRVFVDDKEYVVKNIEIGVPSRGEKESKSDDWNIVCEGQMLLDRSTSTIKIFD